MATTQQERDKRKEKNLQSGLFKTIQRNCDAIHYSAEFDSDLRDIVLQPTDEELLALGKVIYNILYR